MKIPPSAALLLALLALSTPSNAQADLEQSGGILGENVRFGVQGPPNKFFILFPSKILTTTTLFCGLTLDVGLDLVNLAVVGQTDGTGNDLITINLPVLPALLGIPGHTQIATILLGSMCFFDGTSNRVTTMFTQHGLSVNTFGENVFARQGHTLSLQADGDVVVMGGDEPGMGGLNALDTIETYDTNTHEFSLEAATLTHPRSAHTATTLADGRILLVGGADGAGIVRNTAEIYDPVAGTITAVASMTSARTQHTATLMQDGRVFVAGGSSLFDLSDVLASLAMATKTTEIYDPVLDSWSAGPNLPISEVGLIGQSASLLANGQVLISGGVVVAVVFGFPIPSFTGEVHRYDPGSNNYVATSSLSTARVYHGQLTLPDGRVLVAGGATGDFVAQTFSALAGCETYDPNTNLWTGAPALNHARAYPNLIDTGTQIAAVGGLAAIDIVSGSGVPEQNVELAAYTVAAWTDSGTMLLPREIARAVPIEGGDRILIVGTGDNGVVADDRTAELFVP